MARRKPHPHRTVAEAASRSTFALLRCAERLMRLIEIAAVIASAMKVSQIASINALEERSSVLPVFPVQFIFSPPDANLEIKNPFSLTLRQK